MPESTLAVTWDEARMRVAFFRGFGPDPEAWDDEAKGFLKMALRKGARLFYLPQPVGGPTHHWTFLKPKFRVRLPQGVKDVEMPGDFAYLVGSLFFLDEDTSTMIELERRNDTK